MVGEKKSAMHGVKGKQVAAAGKASSKAKTASRPAEAVTIDRRASHDRRATHDRREQSLPVTAERRVLERRVKVNRRRQIDPTTCERDYSIDEVEFMNAMDDYKRRSGRMFPTCSEVLEVVKSLGYEKRTAADSMTLPAVELPGEILQNVPTVVG